MINQQPIKYILDYNSLTIFNPSVNPFCVSIASGRGVIAVGNPKGDGSTPKPLLNRILKAFK